MIAINIVGERGSRAADSLIEELVQRKQLVQRTATIEKVKEGKPKMAEEWPLVCEI